MENEKVKKPIYKKAWFYIIIFILCIIVIGGVLLLKNKDSSSSDGLVNLNNITLGDFNKNGTANEKVLYEQNNVKITFKKIEYTDYSANLTFEFVNNDKEKLKFMAGTAAHCINSINEFMVSTGFINVDVEPGESKTDVVRFNYDEMRLLGIDEIAEVNIDFAIDADDYKSNFNQFNTGSLQIKTSLYDSYNFNNDKRYIDRITSKAIETKYNNKILKKKNDIYSIAEGLDVISNVSMENKDGENILMIEIKNNSGKDIYAKIKNIKFNGILTNEYLVDSDYILNGKKSVLDIDISDEKEREEAQSIENIKTITYDVCITDSNDTYTELVSKEITFEL